MISACLLLVTLAHAAPTLTVISEDGAPVPGRPGALTLVLSDSGQPVLARPEDLSVSAGTLGELEEGGGPGIWRAPYTAPAGDLRAVTVSVSVDGVRQERRVALGATPASGLSGPAALSASVGQQEPVILRMSAEGTLDPEALQLSSSEGRFGEVTLVDGGVEVAWWPAELPEPRAVPIAVRDGRLPGAAPHWVTVSLSSRAPLSVRTEPGTRMSVRVNGRSYGPVVAGADGQAAVRVEVRPGETVGEALLEDALGNSQRSSITLLRDPRPSLVVLAEGALIAGAPPPALHLRALSPAGMPWRGEAPSCATGAGQRLGLTETGAGTWIAALPPTALRIAEVRVDCVLAGGAASATARLPVREGQAERIELRVWPEELTGDLPVAQVRAWLEDSRGDPLPPEGLVLSAERGAFSHEERSELALRADFEADPLSATDQVRATWTASPKRGPAWSLRIGVAPGGPEDGDPGSALQAHVRAVDRLGRPLADVAVEVALGSERRSGRTDERGYFVVALPAPADVAVLEARAGALVRRAAVTPWWAPPPLTPGEPDLVAEQAVRVRVGRVSKVSVRAEPRVLYTGGGGASSVGWVEVLLVDRAGRPVTDEGVRLEASEGEVGELELRADGTLRAQYTPPSGLTSATVEVRVISNGGAFPVTSTRFDLEPRPVSWAPGISAGVITTFSGHTAFHGSLQLDRALPWLPDRQLYGRLSVGYHQLSDTVIDEARGGEVELRMDLLPVSLSALMRRDLGLWAGWTGVGITLAPYRLDLSFGGEQAANGLGLHRPGPLLYAGGGRRFTGGEVFGELRGLSVLSQAEGAGYDGQVGGVVFLMGYRVLY